MNTIRLLISLFILALIAVSLTGWIWTGHHQPATESHASHLVLGMSALAGLGGLFAVWRARPAATGTSTRASSGLSNSRHSSHS